jgi:hypothetical protein
MIIYFNSHPPAGESTQHIISYFRLQTGCSEHVLYVSRALSVLLTAAAFEVTDRVCFRLVELNLCWTEKRRLTLFDPMSDLVRHYDFLVPAAFRDP